jgi:hypothetical protein
MIPDERVKQMKPFWISWHAAGPFIYNGPWWVSGYRWNGEDRQDSICAAVMAEDEAGALATIRAAHDVDADLEIRFNEPQAPGWSPFSDRFPRADWMEWPHP